MALKSPFKKPSLVSPFAPKQESWQETLQTRPSIWEAVTGQTWAKRPTALTQAALMGIQEARTGKLSEQTAKRLWKAMAAGKLDDRMIDVFGFTDILKKVPAPALESIMPSPGGALAGIPSLTKEALKTRYPSLKFTPSPTSEELGEQALRTTTDPMIWLGLKGAKPAQPTIKTVEKFLTPQSLEQAKELAGGQKAVQQAQAIVKYKFKGPFAKQIKEAWKQAKAAGVDKAAWREYVDSLKESMFRQELTKKGIDYKKLLPVQREDIRRASNATEYFQSVDEKAYTDLTMLPQKIYESINTGKHIGKNLIEKVVLPLERQIKAAKISEIDLAAMLRGEKEITPAAKPLIDRINQLDKTILGIKRNVGFKVLEKPGYPAFMRRRIGPIVEMAGKPPTVWKEGVKDWEPTFAKHMAKVAPMPEEVYKEGIIKLLKQDIAELEHAFKVTPDIINQYKRNVSLLNLEGHTSHANFLTEYMKDVTGMGKGGNYKIFLDEITSPEGKILVDKIAGIVRQNNPSILKRFVDSMNRLMFGSWVGANPRALFKQIIQPHVVGGAEVGEDWIFRAEKLVLQNPKYLQLSRAKRFLAPPTGIDPLEGMQDFYELSKTEKGIRQLTDWLMTPFTAKDQHNRLVNYTAAYEKTLKQGLKGDVLEGLLPSQVNYILEGHKTGGITEAAFRHGILRSLRANYMYSIADKPELLRSGLGSYFPFTTWGRNQIMRFMGDINTHNYKNVARRLAVPLVFREMIVAATGHEVSGMQPWESAAGIVGIEPMPMVTGPIEQLMRGKPEGAKREALSLVPGYQDISRIIKKEKAPFWERYFGMKPAKSYFEPEKKRVKRKKKR